MKLEAGYKYTEKDEWVNVEGNTATIGISDFAQDQLSDIVYLEYLVSEGDAIEKGTEFGTIESVKAASDIYCPVSGTVIALNEDLRSPTRRSWPGAASPGPDPGARWAPGCRRLPEERRGA